MLVSSASLGTDSPAASIAAFITGRGVGLLITDPYTGRKALGNSFLTRRRLDRLKCCAQFPYVARKQHKPTFIRQWRKHRGYSVEKLAGMIETTGASLSRIERGLQPYNQDTLERLAEALTTDPASLLIRDPSEPEAIWSLWDRAKPGERAQIRTVAEALIADKKTGTSG